jgi:alpha-2-macroglobulin
MTPVHTAAVAVCYVCPTAYGPDARIMSLSPFRLLALFCCLTLVACDDTPEPAQDTAPPVTRAAPDAAWDTYLAGHSAAQVPAAGPLQVRFSGPVIGSDQLEKPLEKLVTITPQIEAEARFVSEHELVIRLASPLQAGQAYQVSLNPAVLPGVPLDTPYQFSVSALPQSMDLRLQGLAPVDDDTMQLAGELTTLDLASPEAIQTVLQAHQGERALPVTWQHDAAGRTHSFLIEDIRRSDQASEMVLRWQGAGIGADQQGDRTLRVPARHEFSVTDVRITAAERQYIAVSFSAPLAARQNLAGLVRLDGKDASARIEGSQLRIYPPENFTGEARLRLEPGLRSEQGGRLGEPWEQALTFVSLKPGVRFVGKGVVLPENDRLTVPFEAVNVRAVTVTALKVYRNNIGQFFQQNSLTEGHGLQQVGRYLWRREFPLNELPRDRWQRYLLDVSELVADEPGTLFQLELRIDRDQVLFECSDAAPTQDPARPLDNWEAPGQVEGSGWDGIENWFNDSGYVAYSERHNPCSRAYYVYDYDNPVSATRNLLASNLGLLAKQGSDNTLRVVTTHLRNAQPAGGVEVEVFNYQQQRIGKGVTDARGMLTLPLDGAGFYMTARRNDDRGYLKLSRGMALPTSQFDVGGVQVRHAVKGHLYGERDIWRPGDDMHLTFVLEDREQVLPAKHPVTLELYDPRGNRVASRTSGAPVGNFYPFTLNTDEDAPTGQWRVLARVGGMLFDAPVRIETVVPNRLSVNLDVGEEPLRVDDMPRASTLFGQWLSGATAANLKADVKARLSARPTRFNRFTDYRFDDPARSFSSAEQTVFEGRLDAKGYARFPLTLLHDHTAPGMLRATFTSRVFEQGGQFSVQSRSVDYHPWPQYVGLKLPAGDQARNMLLTDTDHAVRIAALDSQGEPLALKDLEVSLYKIEWRWWWDQGGEALARYASSAGHLAIQQGKVSTDADGKGEWSLRINYPEWGRYLLRVCDPDGGHCAGEVFYMDWPGWAGRAREERGEGASRLTLYTDRTEYTVGDTATVRLPETEQGRALVSVENGSRILNQYWLELGEGEHSFEVPVTAEMAPNVYVSVTLLQPHAGRENDRPLRLFGLVPLMVSDPATHLHPQLTVADTVRPQQPFRIRVQENDGKPMTYTLAVVDEGLLGLTNFRTPDLHKEFFRREALGVRTWDLFDEVAGAYAGALERLIAIGGSDAADMDDDASRKRRFPPVVRFLGAFELGAGETREHEMTLPQYLGAVRVMLVAGDNGRYGRAEKTVTVRDPLALLTTLPRVLGPGEQVSVPVNLFVQSPEIRDVAVTLEADSLFTVTQGDASVSFDAPGEAITVLGLSVGDEVGSGEIRVSAQGGGEQTQEAIFMTVRSPNPSSVTQWQATLPPGETWTQDFTPHGLAGTNSTTLEISSVPPLHLGQRLQYLIQYPHGCLEQVTSAAFPQLYLPGLMALSEAQQLDSAANVQRAIDRLRGYQLADGGFAYWPGASGAHDWATSYAGHFLLEAQRLGYAVPADMLDRWRNHQRQQARGYLSGNEATQLAQAYRLYTLVRAGAPETGAMNRLRETAGLAVIARWQLAAAYQAMGMLDVAAALTDNASTALRDYDQPGDTFGSALRDRAILLPVLDGLKREDDAEAQVQAIAESLGGERWYSTQSVAWALMALSRYFDASEQNGLDFAWRQGDGEWVSVRESAVLSTRTPEPEAGAIAVRNNSAQRLYVVLSNRGVPAAGNEQARANGLQLQTRFTGLDGQPLAIDRLGQGTDIRAEVTVTNTSGRLQQQLALTQILPSGWQVSNDRLAGAEAPQALTYQDIRDDRVLSYFSLKAGESRTVTLSLNASFAGRFYLPGWQVENMYDAGVQAQSAGRWVTVEAR